MYSKKLRVYEIMRSTGIYHQKRCHLPLPSFDLDRDDDMHMRGNSLRCEEGIGLKVAYAGAERVEGIKLKERK
jgi:hypothetical protein